MEGLFIAFEGITGSGKKTHIKILADRLIKEGKEVTTISFPNYETEVARLTKKVLFDPFTLSLLFAADRTLYQERIKGILSKGNFVITDRYCYSNFAYQSVKGVPLEWLMKIEEKIIKPDIVFLIDVPVEMSMKRVQQAKIEEFTKREILARIERERNFLEKIREAYLQIAKANREAEWFIIDGTQDMSKNHEEIWSVIEKRLK